MVWKWIVGTESDTKDRVPSVEGEWPDAFTSFRFFHSSFAAVNAAVPQKEQKQCPKPRRLHSSHGSASARVFFRQDSRKRRNANALFGFWENAEQLVRTYLAGDDSQLTFNCLQLALSLVKSAQALFILLIGLQHKQRATRALWRATSERLDLCKSARQAPLV